MTKPENTAERDPLLHFIGGLDDHERYITDMESAGQRQLVASDRLPVQGPDEQLRALGFQLGEPDPADPLFRPVVLPEGWRREGSDHAMWSYILDRNGRRRVAVFYKAAYYDRKAHCSVETAAGYVQHLLWGDDPWPTLIVDEWTTRDVLIAEVRTAREHELRDATERESYYPKGAESARERVRRCDHLLEALGAADA